MNVAPLFLGIASKDFLVDNMEQTGLYKYVYDLQSVMMVFILLIYGIFISIYWLRKI